MKVKLNKDYKSLYTIEELQIVKKVILWEKENDEYTLQDWVEYASREVLKDKGEAVVTVLACDAYTAFNNRIWDAYFDGSRDADVWIEGTVKTSQGFLEVGAYLSDIWQTGSVDYRGHMVYQYYKRV